MGKFIPFISPFFRSRKPASADDIYKLRGTGEVDAAAFEQQFGVYHMEIEFMKDLEKYGFINVEVVHDSKNISVNDHHSFLYNAFYNDFRYAGYDFL